MSLVSVVIRNYNGEEFLRDALESAFNQSHPAVEIVVVDDGSTDGSRALLQAYADRCTLVLKDNGGEGSAINAGFAAATGEIVLFLDSDDVLAPQALSQVVAAWAPAVARAHFPMHIMNRSGALLNRLFPHYKIEQSSLDGDLALYGQMASGGQSSNAYAAWALRRILPLDETIWRRAPDCYLNALTSAQGRTELIQTSLGGYRLHGGNLTLLNALDDRWRNEIVLLHPRLHRAIRNFIGDEQWRQITPRLPTYHWLHRLLSFLVNREHHPYPSDRLGFLLKNCIAGIAVRPHTALTRRLLLLSGMFALVALPRTARRRLLPSMLRIARATSRPLRLRWPPSFSLNVGAVHWREAFAPPAHRGGETAVHPPYLLPE